jgi:hypothetical protein
MASRKLEDLYPPFRQVIEKALKIADAQNLPITITCTKRSMAEQEALYAQGREELVFVNAKRKKVGLSDITLKRNKQKVTWTLNTYHNTDPKSMGVDYAIGKSSITWDVAADTNSNKIPDYTEFGNICKSIDPENIQWGGDWTKKDWCHIQWKNGRNIDQSLAITDDDIEESPIPIDPAKQNPVVEPPEPLLEKTEDEPQPSPSILIEGTTTVAPTREKYRVVKNILRLLLLNGQFILRLFMTKK